MSSRIRTRLTPLTAALLTALLGLQGCVAAHVAGATVGLAGAAVKTTAKVAGAAVHLAAKPAKPASQPPPQ